MGDLRKDCPMRHENGNCAVIGGFCTAVNDPICEGLHNAYDNGYRDAAIRARQERENTKPMANADRIRAMSDEELAEIIACHKGLFDRMDCFDDNRDCKHCTLEWLKQPAEEDN